MISQTFRTRAIRVTTFALLAGACGRESIPPQPSNPLEGIRAVVAQDSSGQPIPAPPMLEPGFFRGIALGYEPGPDTIAGAVRLPNVTVTAYPYLVSAVDAETGPAKASVLSNAEGEWQLPLLPAGNYAITFTPPDATFESAWTVGSTHANSGEERWWIFLRKK